MTRGDIHNLDGALDNTINKIKESQHIAERDKDLLVRGTGDIPSFLSCMQSKGRQMGDAFGLIPAMVVGMDSSFR